MTHVALTRKSRVSAFALISVAVVALDQAAKAAVRASLVPGRTLDLVPGIMDLQLVENTGAAFSLGRGSGWAFVLVALAVASASAAFVWRREGVPAILVASLACVAGGGIGNLVDRVARGSVTDFLATSFMDFPVFNVADVFVTCGIVVSLVVLIAWDPARAGACGDDGGAGRPR